MIKWLSRYIKKEEAKNKIKKIAVLKLKREKVEDRQQTVQNTQKTALLSQVQHK